ncbi:helix-turn-helix domain-containing protein, partial [Streptomonospora salina]
MQLRYRFRLYPNGPQRQALARAFGCARVVFNDGLRAREAARAEGGALPTTGGLSATLITEAKKTDERAWSGDVSAVVLQQALRDLDAAYRTFFDGLKGTRPRVGAPRFKSRKDRRQTVRFTA